MDAIIDYRGKTPEKTDYGIPLITAKIVKGGQIQKPEEFISPADYDSWMRRGIPAPGDIVLTTEAPLGEVAQLDKRKVALAQRLIALRGKRNLLDNTFLKYLMQSDFVQDQLKSRASGSTVSGIKQSELRKIDLFVPPLPIQHRIAHILGSLDDKIELNRHMNETLEAMASAIFKSWFVDFDPVRAKAEGRKPVGIDAETAALFPDGFEEVDGREMPRGWGVGPISNCCQRVENGGTPRRDHPEYWDLPEIPWLTSGEVRQEIITSTENRISKLGFENSSAKLWPKGTSVIALYGATAGQVSLISTELCANQACCALIPKNKMRYFNYLAMSSAVKSLEKQASGSAQQNLSQKIVAEYEICQPSQEILNQFDNVVEPLFEVWISNIQQSRTLGEIRGALLPKLMSGEINILNSNIISDEAL